MSSPGVWFGAFSEEEEGSGDSHSEDTSSAIPWGLTGSVLGFIFILKRKLLVMKTWHLDSSCSLKWLRAKEGDVQLGWDAHHGEAASWKMRASSQGRHRRLLPPFTWSCLLRSKRVEEEPKTVRDKSKVLVGRSPRCLKDAIYPELLLVVQA